MLDENTGNNDGYGDEEIHNPDQILFQFDDNGNVYPKQQQQQQFGGYGGNYGHGQIQQNADNFAPFAVNNNPNVQIEMTGHHNVHHQENEEPQEVKYPYEANNNDFE